jgi:SAM-dependent methyltransferase
VRGTIGRIRRLVATRSELRRSARKDRAFDEERGVETAAWVRAPELDTDSAARVHAASYQPTHVDEFELLMEKLHRQVDVSDFTFVDYGSGKGRVLILAADHPFKHVVGVEFSESLWETSRKNLEAVGADMTRVEVVHGDATAFELPSGPVVLYFFHPFEVPVLRPVLERIARSLDDDPRPANAVVTGPPDFVRAVDEAGFERLDVDELGWATRGVFRAPKLRVTTEGAGGVRPARMRGRRVASPQRRTRATPSS